MPASDLFRHFIWNVVIFFDLTCNLTYLITHLLNSAFSFKIQQSSAPHLFSEEFCLCSDKFCGFAFYNTDSLYFKYQA